MDQPCTGPGNENARGWLLLYAYSGSQKYSNAYDKLLTESNIFYLFVESPGYWSKLSIKNSNNILISTINFVWRLFTVRVDNFVSHCIFRYGCSFRNVSPPFNGVQRGRRHAGYFTSYSLFSTCASRRSKWWVIWKSKRRCNNTLSDWLLHTGLLHGHV